MTRLLALALTILVQLAVVAGASAAELKAVDRCAGEGGDARFTGSGFAPDSQVELTIGKQALGAVTADGLGRISFTITNLSPLPVGRGEQRRVVRAVDPAGTEAQAPLYVTLDRAVVVRPRRTDNVETWRAVFRLFGFGAGKAFVHYVNPQGNLQKTVRLGALRRPCGRLKTNRRRVLPIRNPQHGEWKLQFDTRRRYDPDTANKRVLPLDVFRD